MKRSILSIVLTGLFLLTADIAAAATVGWRGDGLGKYPDARPATEWSADRNVAWKADTPSWSNATPVVVGDRVFICSEPNELVCLDAKDGRSLWREANPVDLTLTPEQVKQREADRPRAEAIAEKIKPLRGRLRDFRRERRRNPGDATLKEKEEAVKKRIAALEKEKEPFEVHQEPVTHQVNGHSSCTPVSDGRRVWALFGNGVVAAFDLEGKRLWTRRADRPGHAWGHSASPLLVDGRLIVHVADMVAFDPETGEEQWRLKTQPGWGTAAVARPGGDAFLVTPKGDIVRVSDGQKIASGLFAMPYGSPVMDGDTVYSIDEKGAVAVRLAADGQGGVKTEQLWTSKPRKDRYYASPVIHDGLVYVVNRVGHFSCLDAKTGEILYDRKLDFETGRRQNLYPSVALAGDRLFVSHENGTTFLLAPGRTLEILGQNTLEPFRSTPVFVGDRMYVRSLKRLYCIAPKGAGDGATR